jgi:hypothetical protein
MNRNDYFRDIIIFIFIFINFELSNFVNIISIYFKITLLSLITFVLNAQNISGNLTLLANQTIKLEGFKGLQTYLISSSTIDDKGNFKLTYAKTDFGVGYQCTLEK